MNCIQFDVITNEILQPFSVCFFYSFATMLLSLTYKIHRQVGK